MFRISALVAVVALVVAPPSSPRGLKYTPYKLYELAVLADVIVVGRIADVDHPTFEVAIERQVAGTPVRSSIEVQCFKDWTCAARWAKYEPGQRVLLFLRSERGKPYRIMGGGGEGEMPATESGVVVRHYPVRDVAAEVHVVDGHEVQGALLDLKTYEAAMLAFRDRFEVGVTEGFVASVAPKGTAETIAEFVGSSVVARHLYEEARSSEQWVESSRSGGAVSPGSIPRLIAKDLGLSGTARIGPGREPDRFGFELDPWFGHAAAFIGDVDGDGIDELAVGAPKDSYLGHFHGAVWIFFLNEDGTVRALSEISEAKGSLGVSMTEFAQFGTAVAPLGDLDGDGIPDLVAGAPHWNVDGEEWRGGVWVLFLRRDGTVKSSVELGSSAALRSMGVGDGYGIGQSLANLGDLDGDGTIELAVGQDRRLIPFTDAGRSVLILSLRKDGSVGRVQQIDSRADGFVSRSSWFGDAIAAVGDIDGNGVCDMAISDTYDDDGGEVRGAIWICFLDKDATLEGKQKISDWAGGYEGLLKDEARLGLSLAAPGDLDGDDVPDLVAGSSEGIHTLFLNRDGTVKRFVDVSEGRGGFTDVGALGRSIALRSAGERRQLAVGGAVGEEDVLWLLDLLPDGTVAAWR